MSTCHPPFMVCRRPASVNRKVTSVAVCWSNHTKIRLGKEINRCTVVVANDGGRSFFWFFLFCCLVEVITTHRRSERTERADSVGLSHCHRDTIRPTAILSYHFLFLWMDNWSFDHLEVGQVTSSSPSRTHTHTRILYLLYDLWPGAVLCVFASHAYKFDCIATHR